MQKKIIIGLTAVLIFIIGLLVYKVLSQNEVISSLKKEKMNNVILLNQKNKRIAELEEEVIQYENQMRNVEHFDNYSPSRNSSLSSFTYTGGAIETQIDGDFEGWDGDTIFKMMDGSIWQQASYAYTYHYAYSPEVLIFSKNGTTFMKVEGVDDEIQVKRIR